MTSVASSLRKLASRLSRRSLNGAAEPEAPQVLVYRLRETCSPNDPWERRILDLGDGRSVAEITETLYWEEVRAGAWAADVGLWKELFDRSVVETIGKLAGAGCVYLRPVRRA